MKSKQKKVLVTAALAVRAANKMLAVKKDGVEPAARQPKPERKPCRHGYHRIPLNSKQWVKVEESA